MVEFQRKDFYSYEDFLEIMRLLRAPGGCPWDREQTHGSIRRNFLEETYEAVSYTHLPLRPHRRRGRAPGQVAGGAGVSQSPGRVR